LTISGFSRPTTTARLLLPQGGGEVNKVAQHPSQLQLSVVLETTSLRDSNFSCVPEQN
jgi:hypothetical protein